MRRSETSTETVPRLTSGRAPARLSASLRLSVVAGPDRGLEQTLPSGRHIIGHAPGCALQLSDRKVSRRHLEIIVDGDRVAVRDLGSKNGSSCDGLDFKEASPRIGAILALGDTRIKIMSAVRRQAAAGAEPAQFEKLIGTSPPMRALFELLEKLAPLDVTVLIEGETGTGKELCAQSIHAASRRAKGPLVVCDLSGLSESLLESELFGHRRGAFTGAENTRKGLLVEADGGTLFIDEIGELALNLQPRLLRAIENRQAKPVGSDHYQRFDARIICATNRDLNAECKRGRFREDLFHRFVMTVKMPPLRERVEDIPLLAERLLDGSHVTLAADALALLMSYRWPGNVRELRNVLDRAVVRLGGGRELNAAMLGLQPPDDDHFSEQFLDAKEQVVTRWERDYLGALLRRTDGNVARAARESGLHRPYLHRLLKKHGLVSRRRPPRE